MNGYKTKIMGIFGVLLFTAGVFAQSIVVTKPAAGDIWRKNTANLVTWNKTGAMAATVKIRLFDASGNTTVLPVVDSTPNTGSYTVPAGFFNGISEGSYTIRVRTEDNQTYGQSAVFQLKNAMTQLQSTPKLNPDLLVAPSITITSPVAGTAWLKATSNSVTWTKTGIMGSSVKIRLLDASGKEKVKDVVENINNSGTHKIAAGFFNDVPKGNYTIRVRTMDNNVLGDSAVFRLVDGFSNLPTMNYIKVKAPVKDAVFKEGGMCTIKIESNMSAPFVVELVKAGTKGKVMNCAADLKPRLKAPGQTGPDVFEGDWSIPQFDYNWMIKYRIRVANGLFEDYSEPFKIGNVEKTTVYEIPVTQTVNKISEHWHKYDKKAFSVQPPPEEPDPGPGKMRVGYTHYKDNRQYENRIYRSWVFFDLSSLKGKGLVTKASLVFSRYAGCSTFVPSVKILDDKWSGDPGALFSVAGVLVSPTSLPVNRLHDWLLKDQNYGLVFIGPNESLNSQDNNSCVALFDQLKLIVEMSTL